jgi:hypothetical protein
MAAGAAFEMPHVSSRGTPEWTDTLPPPYYKDHSAWTAHAELQLPP